ncbi:ferrochelatase [Candidatus Nitrosoglobus terrae]|uniref:Ferrochelatase n=1 Tax=Candidatus Nitrosoglobus terrae TaxID=1630141 RepID=A0A1Q2SL38_9GAMM|nr:ferrochelatase [Candidatus Nitrosoglobus terrae]BAW79834.1 ferrochelatase [Candidatus Nitrosoglobus terrae]
MDFKGHLDYRHDRSSFSSSTGILVTSLGTPEAPTAFAVRRFLAEFLSDPRVVEMSRPLWWFILHSIVLPIRPFPVARLYQSIWQPEGSPLLIFARRVGQSLQNELNHRGQPMKVSLGMRYGSPSITQALEELRQAGVERLLVFPLYPQYSGSTTGSTFDAIAKVLSTWRWIPELRMITHYHDHPGYLQALAESIRRSWQDIGRGERLLFSFHGLPKRYLLAGDPYHCFCHKTARLVADQLGLEEGSWQVAFQSRFGREEWLKPYADHLLREWAKTGVKRVDVVCPGFAVDCLETLEEMAQRNRELFLRAGGEEYRYISALNDNPSHICALADLIEQHTQGWANADSKESIMEAAKMSYQRAIAFGANN